MNYEVKGVKYEVDSAKNQNIIDRLVNREVYCCMTQEVEYMLSRIPYDDDDNPFDEDSYENMMVLYCPECEASLGFKELTIANLRDDEFEEGATFNRDIFELEEGFICPICGSCHKTIQEARLCCGVEETVYRCLNCGKILNEDGYDRLDMRRAEVYEWWAVSNWFGKKLKEQNCVVIESWGKSYWGRCTTGQSISLDGCIANIAKSMKILDGMENDWGT